MIETQGWKNDSGVANSNGLQHFCEYFLSFCPDEKPVTFQMQLCSDSCPPHLVRVRADGLSKTSAGLEVLHP